MEKIEKLVSDLGELRLLREIILPDVSASTMARNDDCAHLHVPGGELLWSMDPCPTPVANWFGKASAEVWGCYTATINLSDIAASGGTPLGMLVSIEMPDDTPVEFVRGFQRGLMTTLKAADVQLFGGNIKSTKTFSATGTIIGTPGERTVSRRLESDSVSAYLIGPCGDFWSAVVANTFESNHLPLHIREQLDRALCFPKPQTEAGKLIGKLPFDVACMDCSDGPANALYQLAQTNDIDLNLLSMPNWPLAKELLQHLDELGLSKENACYSFGDWQLACLVPTESSTTFESMLNKFTVTKLGTGAKGAGLVKCEDGRKLRPESLNQNFQGGYNSIAHIEDLVNIFMRRPIFH